MTADYLVSPRASGLAGGAGGPAASACLTGRWERSLLRGADGSVDRLTSAVWLQGPSLYVDLRLPAGRPAEGFAGALTRDGRVFEWRHDIDLRPRGLPDAAALAWEGGRLVERGIHDPYVEHWRRAPALAEPCWGVRLASRHGRQAVLVRVGTDVGWACGPGPAEVSLARVHGDVATITSSSSRVRAGARLVWSITPTTATVAAAGPDGMTRTRWRITHREGAPA